MKTKRLLTGTLWILLITYLPSALAAADDSFNNDQWTVGVQADYYSLDMPNFYFGTTELSNNPVLKFDTDASTVMPTISISRRLSEGCNCHLPCMFNHASVEFTASYFNTEKESVRNGGAGVLNWDVIHPVDGAPQVTSSFDQSRFKSHYTNQQYGLFFKGNDTPAAHFKPHVGLTYQYFKQNYDLAILDTFGLVPLHNTLDENIDNHYFGLEVGGTFRQSFHKNVALIARGSISGVYSYHKFKAYEVIDDVDETKITYHRASDTDHGLSMDANVALGVEFYGPTSYYIPNSFDNRMKLRIEGGLDLWGHVAKVNNPMRDGEKAHITDTSAVNKFVAISLIVPL